MPAVCDKTELRALMLDLFERGWHGQIGEPLRGRREVSFGTKRAHRGVRQ
jgi:hypothetical protein